MKTTEIVTAHNVIIQYELASIFNRALALLLDLVILFFYTTICTILFTTLSVGFAANDMFASGETIYTAFTLIMLPVFFYSFIMEAFFGGQSIGKMALGIRVVKVSGSTPSMGELFLRWSFRLIDILLSVGSIAALSASSSDKMQRLGDVIANTCVIKLKSSAQYSIKDILTIKSKENYVTKYPQVVQLSDEDMLLVKNSIDRLRSRPNKQHKELIAELSKRVSEKLNITTVPKNKVTFLKTVLQDYIVLTRS
ncbi:MAG: RDD family protein [Flavobacteriales bacterium]|nr:RDD family protein [Flavobacteriales bacterium]